MTSMSSIAPFVAPFGVFMLCLAGVDEFFPDQHYLLYPIRILLVIAVLAWYWRQLPSLKPASIPASVGVGVLGVVLWVGLAPSAYWLDGFVWDTWHRVGTAAGWSSGAVANHPGLPAGRNPFQLYPAAEAWLLFAIRLSGIALVVPVMEELFWRGFLMRWLIREDFLSLPLGGYQAFSFWATTVCFASVHGSEWPLGLVVGMLYGWWFVRTKRLGSIMVAHGVTNFLLALYCLISGDWHFLSPVQAAHLMN